MPLGDQMKDAAIFAPIKGVKASLCRDTGRAGARIKGAEGVYLTGFSKKRISLSCFVSQMSSRYIPSNEISDLSLERDSSCANSRRAERLWDFHCYSQS